MGNNNSIDGGLSVETPEFKKKVAMLNEREKKIRESVEDNVEDDVEDTSAVDDKHMSKIARDFINNQVDPDLHTVPGLGSNGILLLNAQGILNTNHLIGQFFMVDRDEVNFIIFLEECGIKNQFAREIASKFYCKFYRI